MRQGECDSSFPTLDGSCNHPEDAGRSMQSYKRLVPANYCDGKQSARCSVRNKAELPSERTISLGKYHFFKSLNQNILQTIGQLCSQRAPERKHQFKVERPLWS